MPIYEYRCGDCDRHFERYLATTAGTASCPSCGGGRVKRTLSLFSTKSEASPVASSVPAGGGGGGCCGGGCGCH
jgi:putative FmdB family regulatory protein